MKTDNFLQKFFCRLFPVKARFAIFDDLFPSEKPFGFRNIEFNGLLHSLPDCKVFNIYPMKAGADAWFKHGYGREYNDYVKAKQGYLKYYPENDKKICYLNPYKKYKIGCAYSVFLCLTYTLLPFYEKYKIPFVFTLYPGGAFGLDNESSDKMLEDIFSSPYFRKVIVTQKVTYDYLLKKNLCPKEKIHFLFGGYAQFNKGEFPVKQYYPKDKATFDVCFVAGKYSEKGVDKGYDLLVEVAKHFVHLYPDMHFHIVGGFDDKEIDVSDIKDNIHFYGYKTSDFLLDFYSKMDICLSPNRPFKLFKGNFDGFPLAGEAMVGGVALFTTDELNNNDGYFSDDELVIIKPDKQDILQKLDYYYNHLDKLYEISLKGQQKWDIYSPEIRLEQVTKVILEAEVVK